MGLPIRKEILEAAARKESSIAMQCDSCGAHPCQEENSRPDCVFEYGNLRPDVLPDAPLATPHAATRAWLLGSRLYSFSQRGGVDCPAVRLEESGFAVLGYVVKPSRGNGIAGLLEETERRQYSPELYERDIVEVCTERGERVKCYVYHCPDVDRTTPIQDGDWSKWRIQRHTNRSVSIENSIIQYQLTVKTA
ncbi:hypothetical protein R1flu_019810 [Riccia fluitans]|uniref:Gamma-glutamylcyclotransferase AIG2-like domain-containing protein n=1 Tax=Riccia fluitans TaxID=41844 RepID=A0ABD1ZKS4_9MARC